MLTGATGFLAKSILEKILRAIPEVGQIYLPVRAARGGGIAGRIEREVIGSRIFDRLRSTDCEQFTELVHAKISPVEADLGKDRLGLSVQAYEELTTQVTCIINSAAACSFGEQLDRALQVNAIGPHRLLQFAKDAGNIPLVHISTCYVNGTREGDIAEEVLPLGHTVTSLLTGAAPRFDIDREIASMLHECSAIRKSLDAGDRDGEVFSGNSRSTLTAEKVTRGRQHFADAAVVALGKRVATTHGWIDPYPFTKSLGEQLLIRDRGEVPLAIVRPSIIESTYMEPVPGWIEGLRMGSPLVIAMGKGHLPEFGGREDNVLDFVPCDMVTNAVLAAVPEADAAEHCEVFQIASSSRNPLTHRALNLAVHSALHKYPLYERGGEPIRPDPVKIIPVEKFERKIEWAKRWLTVLRFVYARLGLDRRARWAALKMSSIRRLRELFAHYGFYAAHSPRFLVENSEALFAALSNEDKAAYPFDVTQIEWVEYFVERHIPGLARMLRPSAADDMDLSERSPQLNRQ